MLQGAWSAWGRREEREERGKERKEEKEKGKWEIEKEKEGREKEERGREIRAGSAARGRPCAAPITRARSGACVAGCVRGSRANRVMDSGVGVGSFGDREIERNKESSQKIRVKVLGKNLGSTTKTRFSVRFILVNF